MCWIHDRKLTRDLQIQGTCEERSGVRVESVDTIRALCWQSMIYLNIAAGQRRNLGTLEFVIKCMSGIAPLSVCIIVAYVQRRHCQPRFLQRMAQTRQASIQQIPRRNFSRNHDNLNLSTFGGDIQVYCTKLNGVQLYGDTPLHERLSGHGTGNLGLQLRLNVLGQMFSLGQGRILSCLSMG